MKPDTAVDAPEGSPAPGASARSEPGSAPEWVTLASVGSAPLRLSDERPMRIRRVVLQVGAAALAVLVLVAIAGSLVSRRLAERQAVHMAVELTDILANSVVQPVLTDAMANDSVVARAALDPVVRSQVLSASVVRVKIWTPQGKIL
jgi:two-component system NarL family sensor kinase